MKNALFSLNMDRGSKQRFHLLCSTLLLLSFAFLVAILVVLAQPPVSFILPPASGQAQAAAPAGPADLEAYSGQIAFFSQRGGGGWFVMQPDGSDVRPLDPHLYEISREHEKFSPDRRRAAFWDEDILALRSLEDGWVQRLPISEPYHSDPAWSPDGEQIAYLARGSEGFDLHVINVDTQEDVLVTGGISSWDAPSWSPDGKQIAFSTDVDGKQQIGVVNIENGKQTIISSGKFSDRLPVWVKGPGALPASHLSGSQAEDDGFRLNYALESCSEDGLARLVYLAQSSREDVRILSVLVFVDDFEVFNSGSINTDRFADTLDFFVTDSGTRSRLPQVTLEVQVLRDGKASPERGTLSVECAGTAALPAQLVTLLPRRSPSGAESATAEPTPMPLPDWVGKILFTSNRDGDEAYYLMNPDGSEQVRVEEDPLILDHYLQALQKQSTSEQLGAVVYSARSQTDDDIFLYSITSGWIVPLVTRPGDDRDPSWSPDGERIVFSGQAGGETEILVFDRQTMEIYSLTNDLPGSASHPSWSPDGSRIAFTLQDQDGNRQIWVMNADGSEAVNISSSGFDDRDPIWIRSQTVLPAEEYEEYFNTGPEEGADGSG